MAAEIFSKSKFLLVFLYMSSFLILILASTLVSDFVIHGCTSMMMRNVSAPGVVAVSFSTAIFLSSLAGPQL